MNHKERLKEFLSYKEIGQNKFAENCGFSAGYINNIKDSIGSKIINKISIAYPDLNIDWLLTGHGNMTQEKDSGSSTYSNNTMLREAWDMIKDQAASAKAKDAQIDELLAIIRTKDAQANELIDLLKNQITKRGEDADADDYAAPRAAEG